jgi:hypothetical protein
MCGARAVTTREREVVVAELADALRRAEVERVPIAPITEGRPDLTVEDPYANACCRIHQYAPSSTGSARWRCAAKEEQ